MKCLLVSGLGPGFKNQDYLRGSFFDAAANEELVERYGGFNLSQLGFLYRGQAYPLLRPRTTSVPHLTTFTLEAILSSAGFDFETLRTERIWSGEVIRADGECEVILLSTTFIWDCLNLRKMVEKLRGLWPEAFLVLGGQYSNLKFGQIMKDYPEVDGIIRGDGEEAVPIFLRIFKAEGRFDEVPNLVWRRRGEICMNSLLQVDLNTHPSPSFSGSYPVVPYESMRGCPFSCKFCSFPAASPIWRYKSAEKIADDWRRYSIENGARFIKAMDSTFTIPPNRLEHLLKLLPGVGVQWEGYSRANVIREAALLERLASAHCRFLSIGFESMSESTLALMSKKVTAADNRKAFDLLRAGPVGYRCSFMTGYPGETPAEFEHTRNFLETEYSGHFMLSVFSLQDEQMPVWRDAGRLGIRINDPTNPDYSWEHVGMDVQTARALNHATLDAVRSRNDDAVLMLWQAAYQHWLMPHLSSADNLSLEKQIERLAFVPVDVADVGLARKRLSQHLTSLERWGVRIYSPDTLCDQALLEVS